VRDSLCASASEIAVNKIDQTENVNINENVHEKANAKKSVDIEIDLDARNEKIESSTQKESIATEQDFITNAEPLSTVDPVDDAVPVNTGDSDEEIDTLDQNVINLCQTISCNDTVLNVGYDSGATVTLVSKKVAEMSIETKKYMLDTVGEKEGLKSSVTVRIPLAMKNDGMHVLNALVTDEMLGKVAVLPPPL
jgi:flagellar hook protein FlgE